MACEYKFRGKTFTDKNGLLKFLNDELGSAAKPVNDELAFQRLEGVLNTNEVFHKYFGKKGIPTNAKAFLEVLIKKGETEEIRNLAKMMLNSLGGFASSIPVKLDSIQDWQSGLTTMTKTGPLISMQNRTWSSAQDFENTFLHEVIHGATMNFIRNNPGHKDVQALLEMQLDILHKVKSGAIPVDIMGTFDEGYSNLLYSLTGQKATRVEDIDMTSIDPVEAITHALTDTTFRDLLKGINVPKLKKSWWSRVTDSIRTFLGLKAKSGLTENMLGMVTDASWKILETAREYSYDIENFSGPREAAKPRKKKNDSQTSLNFDNKSIKPGVDFVFQQNTELGKIGTPEQYSAYLNIIFPDSKVRNIVYHGTKDNIESFKKVGITSNGIHFHDFKEFWTDFTNITKRGKNIPVLLNITNPDGSKYPDMLSDEEIDNYKNQQIDGIIGDSAYLEDTIIKEKRNIEGKEYVVFEPEQIHILGSAQDVEGFKKFIGNQTPVQPELPGAEIVSPEAMEEHIAKVNAEKVEDAPALLTAKEVILDSLKKNPESKDPYKRESVVSENESISFVAGSSKAITHVIEEQVKGTTTHSNKLIVHSNIRGKSIVSEKNAEIRKAIFGDDTESIRVGDILQVAGAFVKVKSLTETVKQMDDKSGGKVDVSITVITTESGRNISLVNSLNTSEILLSDAINNQLDKPEELTKGDFVFMKYPGTSDYTPMSYGYAVTPDMVAEPLISVVIDEDSFNNESDDKLRNEQLAKAFGASNNITVYSGRIVESEIKTKPDEAADIESEVMLKNILGLDGTLEKSVIGPEYAWESREFAVDGMVEILQTGSIALTAEQIRNTSGLPKGLSTMPYFFHEGNLYINKDMTGTGAIIKELKHLFLVNIKQTKPDLFKKLMDLTRKSVDFEDIKKNMPDATEEQVEFATFMYITESKRPELQNVSLTEMTGTLNEFINSVDEVLKNIDPKLSVDDTLSTVALSINKGVEEGKYIFHRMLLQPDIDAAKFVGGYGGLSMQMHELAMDLMTKGKVIKTCE